MTELLNSKKFNEILESNIGKINSNIPETKAYIQSIFIKFLRADEDLSQKIIILEFEKAKENYSFTKFQEVADWLLYGLSTYPKSFNNCSEDYYFTIGRMSYYKCHKILNNKWPLFEELSDRLDYFVNILRKNNPVLKGLY